MSNYFVAPDPETGELTLYEGTCTDSHRIISRRSEWPTPELFMAHAAGAMLP